MTKNIITRPSKNVLFRLIAYRRGIVILSLQENAKRLERRESDCSQDTVGKGMATSQEDRIVGTISSGLYWDYFTSGVHGILLMFLLLLFLIAQGTCIYC